jgi:membrane-bound ClpP family serine protease
MAMSAGTMTACACKEIWMGKQSSLAFKFLGWREKS